MPRRRSPPRWPPWTGSRAWPRDSEALRAEPGVERGQHEKAAAHVPIDVEERAVDAGEVALSNDGVLIAEQKPDQRDARVEGAPSSEQDAARDERGEGHEVQRCADGHRAEGAEARRNGVEPARTVEPFVLQAVEDVEPRYPGEHGRHERQNGR